MDFGFYHLDCMEGMKEFPDNYFELAIVDPPYGRNSHKRFRPNGGVGRHKTSGNSIIVKVKNITKNSWDLKRPNVSYFKELTRVSRNQIIWGGNYFCDLLKGTSCFIVWDKVNGSSVQADCELAWTSFKTSVRKITYMWSGLAQGKGSVNGHIMEGNNKLWERKIHPTQKPIVLYRWLLQNYAKPGDKILDTHVGSASSLIAFEQEGFDYVGFELDKDYFRDATKRLKQARTTTIDMFKQPKPKIAIQESMKL